MYEYFPKMVASPTVRLAFIAVLSLNARCVVLALVGGGQDARTNSTTEPADFHHQADQSRKIIVELTSHPPRGAILVGKDLPATLKRAVNEQSKISGGTQTAETLTAGLIVIRDMNRYLDYKGL